MQLGHYFPRQHKRVEVRLSHAAGHFVEQGSQSRPVVQKVQKLLRLRVRLLVQRVQGEKGELQVGLVQMVMGQPQADGGVDRVPHVQVMRPAFGPVFPRVGAGVSADVVQPPVGRRAFAVVALQTGGVVLRLVAKQRSKTVHPRRSAHQPVPIVVANFMAKVSQQRAVRLAQGTAHGLADGVVGFQQIERDQPFFVSGHHRRPTVGRAQQVKRQATHRVFRQ